MSTHPQPSADLVALGYRIGSLEQKVAKIETELNLYVPVRENELQLKIIKEAVQRIEIDINDSKRSLGEMTVKLEAQQRENRQNQEEQRQSQDKLQIRVLWFIVSTFIAILVALLIAYLTHFFH